MSMKPYLWQFWDDMPGTATPGYVRLCRESVVRHCENDFEIRTIGTDTIDEVIPGASAVLRGIPVVSHRSDWVRWHLMRDYGGIWLDCDHLIFRSPAPLLDMFREGIDFIGSASPEYKYGNPEASPLICKKGSIVAAEMCEAISATLRAAGEGAKLEWTALASTPLWWVVARHKYRHLPSYTFFPISGLHLQILFEDRSTENLILEETYGVHLFNELIRRYFAAYYEWSRASWLAAPNLLGAMFRLALGIRSNP